MSQKKSTTTTKPTSFRFKPETVELIKEGAAKHRCSQIAYLEMLVRKEKAAEKRESDLISYALVRQNSKLEKLDFLIDDLGSVLLDFIRIYLNDQANYENLGCDVDFITERSEAKMDSFLKKHRRAVAEGEIGLIRRMYDLNDKDISLGQVQDKAQELDSMTVYDYEQGY